MKTKINYDGDAIELRLAKKRYQTNNRLAILAFWSSGAFGVLTVNVEAEPLADDEVIVKTYAENADWAVQVVNNLPEVFTPTGRTAQVGQCGCPVYKVQFDG